MQHGQIFLERRGAEMLVHLVKACQHLRGNCSGPMAIISDRPMAESIEYRPPTQSQNSNMLAVSMPNSATSVGVGRNGDEVLGDRLARRSSSRATSAVARLGVGHRLQRRERLRRDDEQRFGRIQVLRRLGQIRAVDVRDKAERQAAVAVIA